MDPTCARYQGTCSTDALRFTLHQSTLRRGQGDSSLARVCPPHYNQRYVRNRDLQGCSTATPGSIPPVFSGQRQTDPGMSQPVPGVQGKDEENSEQLLQALAVITAKAVTDEDPIIRRHALYLLAATGDALHADILFRALRDPEKAVRDQAARALAVIGTPVVPGILELLPDPDWKVRYRAAEILGMIGDASAKGRLIALLSDPKDHVRYMAAKSLGMIRDTAAIEPLRRCLDDENPFVRKVAATSLKMITGKR